MAPVSIDDYRLFMDLDGVLVDFNRGVRSITGREASELHPRRMWPLIARTKGFYEKLDWMADGKELWDAVRKFHPVVLTGLPMGKWAEPQKRSWCARELGPDVAVITGMSRDKADLAGRWMEENHEAGKIPVLIDDRLKIREPWEAAGGIFILHLTTLNSMEELRKLGFPL